MITLAILATLRAEACPGETVRTDGKRVVANDAAHCARTNGVIGAHCSYATGIMARRILEQGDATKKQADRLVAVTEDEAGGVSAPYRLESEPKSRVIANELVEQMVQSQLIGVPVLFDARELQVDGVTYVVLTAYEVPNS